MRHRETWFSWLRVHVQHRQKSLDRMNVRIHRVISDITGLAIADAIVEGKPDAKESLARKLSS